MAKPLPDWYSYGSIRFTAPQVRWVLENLVMLEDGKWPSEGVETGYTGASSSQLKAEGTQVKPAIIVGEITLRLGQCGRDGHDCLGYYRGQVDLQWLVKHDHCTESDVLRRIWRVIRYATGSCRRWQKCNDCRPLCSHQGRPPETYQEWKLRDRTGFPHRRRGLRTTT